MSCPRPCQPCIVHFTAADLKIHFFVPCNVDADMPNLSIESFVMLYRCFGYSALCYPGKTELGRLEAAMEDDNDAGTLHISLWLLTHNNKLHRVA